MSLALKLGGGAVAVVVVGVLCIMFWPDVKRDKVATKPLVEQPVFMVASKSKPTAAAAALVTPTLAASEPATDKAPVVADKAGLAKMTANVQAAPQMRGLKDFTPPAVKLNVNADAAAASAQGLVALGAGDLAGARSWLQRAADLGDTRAFLALGDAYNPTMLKRLGVICIPGDPAKARDFYNRALSSGLDAARGRLASLTTAAD